MGLGKIDLEGIVLAGRLELVAAAVELRGVHHKALVALDVVAADLTLCLDLLEPGSLHHEENLQQMGMEVHRNGGRGGGNTEVGDVFQALDLVPVIGQDLSLLGPTVFVKDFQHDFTSCLGPLYYRLKLLSIRKL